MRFSNCFLIISSVFFLYGCVSNTSSIDPYESFNRKIYHFNETIDAIVLKPSAKVYTMILPPLVRKSINNAYNNIALLPTIANDLLQADWRYLIKDSWRFLINSSFGVGGLFDIAASNFNLPAHYNDMGITFAVWGDKKSPYLMLPFLGPSTLRDSIGMVFDYTILSPYAYLPHETVVWGVAGLRYVDLRSQLFDSEALLNQALDKYTMIREAYLQHRHFRITGKQVEENPLYVDSKEDFGDYIDEDNETT